jgi:N-acetylglucosaminyldiphosphoundecaprenol N-acetyl-beta-D-mannosaminyltransferase
METYFNLNYEFDIEQIHNAIDKQVKSAVPSYICVADGVVLNLAYRDPEYLKIVNGGMFCICDSSYVPLYLKWIYGKRYQQYCGSQIFMDIIRRKKYRMFFLGTSPQTLAGLKQQLVGIDSNINDMTFHELPFYHVNDFNYEKIAHAIEQDNADIIWIALGAPKQEIFMSKLKPYLRRGVMIGVGAVFKFHSSTDNVKRAPHWMRRCRLEFLHRILSEPQKQICRCYAILRTLPHLLFSEWRRKTAGGSVILRSNSFFRDV